MTKEELLALQGADVSQEPLFHPVSICAMDAASYQAVKTLGMLDDASLLHMQPALHWRWEGISTTSAIALFEPAAHAGQDCLPALVQRELGVAHYPDDPFNPLEAAQWQARGISGRW